MHNMGLYEDAMTQYLFQLRSLRVQQGSPDGEDFVNPGARMRGRGVPSLTNIVVPDQLRNPTLPTTTDREVDATIKTVRILRVTFPCSDRCSTLASSKP